MYPGRLTQTTSSTASKTRRTRWKKEGWLEWAPAPAWRSCVAPYWAASEERYRRLRWVAADFRPLAERKDVGEVKMAIDLDKKGHRGCLCCEGEAERRDEKKRAASPSGEIRGRDDEITSGTFDVLVTAETWHVTATAKCDDPLIIVHQ